MDNEVTWFDLLVFATVLFAMLGSLTAPRGRGVVRFFIGLVSGGLGLLLAAVLPMEGTFPFFVGVWTGGVGLMIASSLQSDAAPQRTCRSCGRAIHRKALVCPGCMTRQS